MSEEINTKESSISRKGAVMSSCLQLSLKTKWFEMTKAGIKTEDYREINYYWIKRFFYLVNSDVTDFIEYLQNPSYYKTAMDIYLDKNNIKYKPFTQNTITLGYPKLDDAERILNIEHKGIEIRTGNPEWGAESSKVYFVIKHGEVIK